MFFYVNLYLIFFEELECIPVLLNENNGQNDIFLYKLIKK